MSTEKHPFKKKLKVVKLYLSGKSSTSLERKYGIDHHDIVMYANRYKKFGEKGIKRSVSKVIPLKEKIEASKEYLEHCLSLPELADKYDVDRRTIRQWARTFESNGAEGLRDNRQGKRPNKPMDNSSDKTANATIKELQERVMDLEAENALLKKVKALVEKREAQLQGTGSKPSKN